MEASKFPDLDPGGGGRWSSNNPAVEHIRNVVRAMVKRGELAPGESVPSTSDLAARWRLSRGTVDRALQGLTDALVNNGSKGWHVRPRAIQGYAAVMKVAEEQPPVAVIGFDTAAEASEFGRGFDSVNRALLMVLEVNTMHEFVQSLRPSC